VTLVLFVVDRAFAVYSFLLIARILLTWVPSIEQNTGLRPVINFIRDITEPYLRLFRGLIPVVGAGGAGFDFSPIIAIIALGLIRSLVLNMLRFFI
jgi:YggT family protein